MSNRDELVNELTRLNSVIFRSERHHQKDLLERAQKDRLVQAYHRNASPKEITELEREFAQQLRDFDHNDAKNRARVLQIHDELAKLDSQAEKSKLARVDSGLLKALNEETATLKWLTSSMDELITAIHQAEIPCDELRALGIRASGLSLYDYNQKMQRLQEPISRMSQQRAELDRRLCEQRKKVEQINARIREQKGE